MAVSVGFEPTEPFLVRSFSKRVLSASQPTHRIWSGVGESNPSHQLGRLRYYHYTNSAYWLPSKDSNLDRLIQSQPSCR